MTDAVAPYFSVGLKRPKDTLLPIRKVGKAKAKSVTVPRKCLNNSKHCIKIKQFGVKVFYANESFRISNCMPVNSHKTTNHAWVESYRNPIAKCHTCLHPVTTSGLLSAFSHCNILGGRYAGKPITSSYIFHSTTTTTTGKLDMQ
jgi:hypothetical protein